MVKAVIKEPLTYSLGNSPRANVQRSEVFPQAPNELEKTLGMKATAAGELHAVAHDDQLSSNL